MDTFRILLDGAEVARVTGEGLEFGKRAKDRSTTEMEDDTKLLKKVVVNEKFGTKHTIFVLMASSQGNVTVERVE